MEEEKNRFSWAPLDTSTLMMPIELLVYHLYRYEQNKDAKSKQKEKDLQILKTYLIEYEKESSVKECLKRQ